MFPRVVSGLRYSASGLRKIFSISPERESLFPQLLAQIARPKRVHPVRLLTRNHVIESDGLVAPREQPEVVPLAVVFLRVDTGEIRSFSPQNLIDVRCGGVPDHLVVVLVLFHDDDDMVVPGKGRGV